MRNRLSRIMRGYRYLKNANSLGMPGNIAQAFTNQKLDISQEHFSKVIFGAGIEQAEIICRQYLLLRCAGLNFNKSLLYALGKSGSPLAHYLPPEWRRIIEKQSVNIASLTTALLWNAFIVMMLTYGFLIIARIIWDSIYALFSKPKQHLGGYVYFNALSAGNIPQPCSDGRSHDIVTWYMQWDGRNPAVNTLCHGVKGVARTAVNGTPVVPVSFIIPPIPCFSSIARFIAWTIGASLLATFDLLRGRWWHALLLNQAALAAQARFQDSNLLAQDYLFHNSGWIYRPLWTYEAERRGSRIIFYFYSTNCEDFKRTEGYPPLYYGYHAMSWPHYLVWDEYQADFVRRAVGEHVKISIVGSIWFQASIETLPEVPSKSIAVFDVTPARDYHSMLSAYSFNYYTPEMPINFLRDIHNLLSICNLTLAWKQKRKIGRSAHPKYRRFIEIYKNKPNIIAVDQDSSAFQLIAACTAVISMPFTSTALIAKEMGKPSIYYDPSEQIKKDDRAAHGVKIVCGPDELSDWVTSVFKTTVDENAL